MHFSTLLQLVLGLASAAPVLALPRAQTTRDVEAFNPHNFEISNLYTLSFSSPDTTWNRAISFHFEDPNSDTSTICTQFWTQSNKTSNPPLSWVSCDNNGNSEVFQWFFTSFTSLKRFSIQFMHGWNDPEHFPPPYEYVGMFSTENTFNLTCVEGNGQQACNLPGSSARKPYRAVVNGLTN